MPVESTDRNQLYIFYILHQTTTCCLSVCQRQCCISFISYIKPQPATNGVTERDVVYLLYPTSNHNRNLHPMRQQWVVYLLYPTSNHNLGYLPRYWYWVVYLLYPTSNHNLGYLPRYWYWVVYLLYPTSNHNQGIRDVLFDEVVYLLYPTSNHNLAVTFLISSMLYIFYILHQTTTRQPCA